MKALSHVPYSDILVNRAHVQQWCSSITSLYDVTAIYVRLDALYDVHTHTYTHTSLRMHLLENIPIAKQCITVLKCSIRQWQVH